MQEYELTEQQLQKLLDASKPTVVIKDWPTPQENANRAWVDLGRELGFKHLTVQPIPGRDEHHFRAEPVDAPSAEAYPGFASVWDNMADDDYDVLG